MVVAIVGVELGRRASAGAASGTEGRYAAEEWLEGLAVLEVGA
jgi:hypothetical protein